MATEKELRALLAEARKWVWASHQAPEARARSEELRQRIDAALAEPVAEESTGETE